MIDDRIRQELKAGEKSICDTCFHCNVCRAVGNQPCVKCSQYVSAADVAPVVRGRWLEEHFQSWIPLEYDEFDNPVLHNYTAYRCDRCGRTAKEKELYCHCGARMDGE